MSPSGLRARAVDYFVEPREAPPGLPRPGAGDGPARGGYRAPLGAAPAPRAAVRAATPLPLRAAVLGAAADAVPVAALLANALRAAAGASTAAVAVWAPRTGAPPDGSGSAPLGGRPVAPCSPPLRGRPVAPCKPPRGGPASFAASRLAGRLTARGLPAAARGRLAWTRLEDHPVAAAVAVRRAAGALEVPLVAVLAGPRCEVVEGLLCEQDLVLVVTSDPDGPLARLAVGSCAGAALAHGPCAAGPGRWLALAGLAGPRGLAPGVRGLVRHLGELPAPLPEVAW